ncbi:MAG: heat-inducible transcriptional repressor HrcA [Clostridia bacterium]
MLSRRKLQVLKAVIQSYVDSGNPVGSRTLTKEHDLGVSAATIRNEMADLEDLGLLEQPYTSAGRVPSDKGYRLYVDSLMPKMNVKNSEAKRIEDEINTMILDKEKLVANIADALAEITSYATIFSGPNVGACKLQEFSIIPINERTIIVVLIADNGLSSNKTIHLPEPLSQEEIQFINKILNYGFKGRYLGEIKEEEKEKILQTISAYLTSENIQLKNILDQMIAIHNAPSITNSAVNVVSQPEFKMGEKYLDLLQVLTTKEHLLNILNPVNFDKQDQIQIVIGNEIDIENMQDCSIVKVSYTINNRIAGALGVIGPKRMDYSKIVALLNYTSERLKEVFKE